MSKKKIDIKDVVGFMAVPERSSEVPADKVVLYKNNHVSEYVFEREPANVLPDGRTAYTQSREFSDLIARLRKQDVPRVSDPGEIDIPNIDISNTVGYRDCPVEDQIVEESDYQEEAGGD